MKYELAHDTLAKQIFLKSSDESKRRRRIKNMVEREYERHKSNRVILLSRPDLLEIKVLGKNIKFSDEEEIFIKRSWRRLRLRQTITITFVTIAFIVLAIFYAYAYLQKMAAEESEEKSKAVALASKAVEYQLTGDDTKALRFAQYSFEAKELPTTKRALYSNFYNRKKFFYSTQQQAHQYDITHAVFSPVPPYNLVTTSLDGTAKIWKEDFSEAIDTIDFVEKKDLKTKPGIHCANFSKDGKLIIFAAEDFAATIYDREQKKIVNKLPHKDWVRIAQFSPANQKEVLTLTNKGKAFIWNIERNRDSRIKSSLAIKSIGYSADGEFIVNSVSGFIEIRNKKGRRLDSKSLEGIEAGANVSMQVSFLPKKIGNFYGIIATNPRASQTKIYLWSPSSGNPQKGKGYFGTFYESITNVLDEQRYVNVHYSEGSNFLGTIDGSQIVRVWDARDFQSGFSELGTISGHLVEVVGIAFHPTKKNVVTYSKDRTFKVWDISSDKILYDQVITNIKPKLGLNEPAIIAPLGSGNIVSVASTPFPEILEIDDSANFILYNMDSGREIFNMPYSGNLPVVDVSSYMDLIALSISPNFSYDTGPKPGIEYGDIRMITQTGVQIKTFRGHDAPITSLHFSESGSLILTADFNGQLKLWDLKNDGNLAKELKIDHKIIDAQLMPKDSSLILITTKDDYDYLRLYNWEGQLLQSIHPNSQYSPPNPPDIAKVEDYYLVLTHNYDKAELFMLTTDSIQLIESFYSYDESLFSAQISKNGQFMIINDESEAKYIALDGPERIFSRLENVHAASFSRNGEYVLVIDKSRLAMERWPWSPKTLIDRINSLNISDLKEEYELVLETIQ